jgi:CBS domain-containing protein
VAPGKLKSFLVLTRCCERIAEIMTEETRMDDRSSEFLDVYNAIDKWLRNQSTSAQRLDFPDLEDSISETNNVVRRRRPLLKEINRLRNLIVHNYSRSRPFAVPTSDAVAQIVAVRDEFLTPPLLVSLAASPVEQCRPDDPLGRSVKKMHDGGFSQLPVYDDQRCLGLLTADTIARWLATHLADGVGLIEERPVSEVLPFQEHDENHTFMPRTATVADGLTAFDTFLSRGLRLDAILITNGGKPAESPLGIVTIHDIPELRRAVRE